MNKYVFYLNNYGLKTLKDDVSKIIVVKNGTPIAVNEDDVEEKIGHSTIAHHISTCPYDAFQIETSEELESEKCELH